MNDSELEGRYRIYVDSLPKGSWQRQLHESKKTPWLIFDRKFGWYEGNGCDAMDAMIFGRPKRLGEPEGESDEEAMALGFKLLPGAEATRTKL